MPGFILYLMELAIDPEPVLGRGGIVLHAAPPEGYLVRKSDPDEQRHVFHRFDADWYARENLDVPTKNFSESGPLCISSCMAGTKDDNLIRRVSRRS